jgi:hypothetical protein
MDLQAFLVLILVAIGPSRPAVLDGRPGRCVPGGGRRSRRVRPTLDAGRRWRCDSDRLQANERWQWIALLFFCILSTSSILAMELYTVFSEKESAARLAALRLWIDNHRDQAIVILSLVAALWLVSSSLYQIIQLNN